MDEKPCNQAAYGHDRRSPRKRVPRKIDARYLENAALYYLQRYASSSGNLKTVLTRKIMRGCAHHGQNAEDFIALLDPLIERYRQAGLLDDAVYADGRVGAMRRQGLSRQSIMQKLTLKGLSTADIATALARIDAQAAENAGDAIDDTAARELAAARRMAQRKRIGPWRRKPISDPKDAQKEMAALARAGFSYDIARRALDSDIDEDFND